MDNNKSVFESFYYSVNREKDIDIQYHLGYFYRNGLGVKKDIKQAIHWFERATKQGGMTSRFHLYQIYKEEEDIKRDINRALYWLKNSMNCQTETIGYPSYIFFP
jgi:TPR repeat protein